MMMQHHEPVSSRKKMFVIIMVKVTVRVSYFQPNQPQRITPGLRETFIKGYLVEKTHKAEIRLAEQREKAESCWENLWNKIQLKGP